MNTRIEDTSEFYATMLEWWSKHEIDYKGKKVPFPPVHIAFLPQKTFVVSDGGTDLYSACFYETDSAMCYVAYPISNLTAPKELRDGGLEVLFGAMEDYAIDKGYRLMYTTSPVKPIQEALLNLDYVYGDVEVTQLLKPIG